MTKGSHAALCRCLFVFDRKLANFNHGEIHGEIGLARNFSYGLANQTLHLRLSSVDGWCVIGCSNEDSFLLQISVAGAGA